MERVCEAAGGAEFCAPSEVTIARLMNATAKRSFMRYLFLYASLLYASGEGVIVLLRAALVNSPCDGFFYSGFAMEECRSAVIGSILYPEGISKRD